MNGQNKLAIYFTISYNKSILIISLKKNWKNAFQRTVQNIFLVSYMLFLKIFAFPLLTVRHIFEISEEVHPWTTAMRPRLLMNFTLRCVRFYPGVNSRAELIALAPGLRPEQPFAPLARPQPCARDYWWTLHFAVFAFTRGVNSRAELVNLAPGLRPERPFAPLARGLYLLYLYYYILLFYYVFPLYYIERKKNYEARIVQFVDFGCHARGLWGLLSMQKNMLSKEDLYSSTMLQLPCVFILGNSLFLPW